MTSGKTTAADYLLKEIPNSKKLTLAGPVYDLVNNIDQEYRYLVDTYILPYYDPRDNIQQKRGLDISEEFYLAWKEIIFETKSIPIENPKPRKRLQFLGTDGARKKIDDQIWIKIAATKARQEPETTWIIDDCRFKNEFDWFEPLLGSDTYQPQIYQFTYRQLYDKKPEAYCHTDVGQILPSFSRVKVQIL